MRLHSARIYGFRRFEYARINLRPRVVAIVGPNEAGKSSLLDALARLSFPAPFGADDLTRGYYVPHEPARVEVLFTLDAIDKNVIDGVSSGQLYRVTHFADGRVEHHFRPIVSTSSSDDGDQPTAPFADAPPALRTRVPPLLPLKPEERSLNYEYDLNQQVGSPSPALANLVRLAGFDLRELLASIQQQQRAVTATIVRKANRRLAEQFAGVWVQGKTGIVVHIDVESTTLRVHLEGEAGELHNIARSSDGIRAFVALYAFVASRTSDVAPILLLDEADLHLHYNAQADLVRVFDDPALGSQVIYTTHSAGCLPQDLGAAIRVVVPDESRPERSLIKDSIWREGPGLSPLVVAMGASVLAFTPARYAVMTEGPSDAILLPTLFREVTGRDTLPFQVAPGLAELRPSRVSRLESEASHVVYLVDADDAGERLRRVLIEEGQIDASRVLDLGLGEHPGLTLEDVVDPATYAKAVNTELETWGQTGSRLSAKDVEGVPRSRVAEAALSARNAAMPLKSAVALNLVEIAGGQNIVADRYRDHMLRLYQAIDRALGGTSDACLSFQR